MKVKGFQDADLSCNKIPVLLQDEVHIWSIQWRRHQHFWNERSTLVDRLEQEQAAGFRFYEDRMRYMAGKIMVKYLLCGYLGEERLEFGVEKYGKPYLKDFHGKTPVQFNLSHSGDRILAAFTYLPAVGCDVQEERPISDYQEIADHYFSAEEAADIREKGGIKAFYQYWALKEAYLKALGLGLNRGMDFFSVRGGAVRTDGKIRREWRLSALRMEGYAAAVAVREDGVNDNV